MLLKEDGIYLPVLVRRFSLVEDIFSLMNVICAVEALTYIYGLHTLYNNKSRKNNKKKSYKKDSFVTKFTK
ncbi:unnamed protein product [Rhizopus microsporus]